MSQLLRGQGEVSMCVLLTHSMVRTRTAVGRRCTRWACCISKADLEVVPLVAVACTLAALW
jgi:hypothetical protein